MAVPRNRTSNAKKNSRSSHCALKPKNFAKCPNCNKAKRSHRICPHCGFYAKKLVIAHEQAAEK